MSTTVSRSYWIMAKGCICTIQTEKNIWISPRDFAVTGLGYDNKELNEALKAQIDKLYHTSNLYYHESLR